MLIDNLFEKKMKTHIFRVQMAAVDNFELLWTGIREVFSSIRDAFALLGAYYVTRKSFSVAAHATDTFYVYFCSHFSTEVDFPRKFGNWAGNFIPSPLSL